MLSIFLSNNKCLAGPGKQQWKLFRMGLKKDSLIKEIVIWGRK